MLNKLKNIMTTNVIYGSNYRFPHSKARGTSLWKTLGSSLMLNKLNSIMTTDVIYRFLQSKARGTLVMFNAANAAGLTDALRKAHCRKYDLYRIGILSILDDFSLSLTDSGLRHSQELLYPDWPHPP